jgi:hypothetical protein
MAKENGAPTAAEKGKGKAIEEKATDSHKKSEETKKDKDGKPIVNGTKGGEPEEGTWVHNVSWQSIVNIALS